LIAEALGATVYRNPHKEIGWFPIEKVNSATDIARYFPDHLNVFQWHGETFTLPPGAIQLMRSPACEQQAFIYNHRVLALQFHLEATQETVAQLVEQCREELVEASYIQPAEVILATDRYFTQVNEIMNHLLDDLMVVSV
jgi:GMP synthase (glutamine-hydrolysing)